MECRTSAIHGYTLPAGSWPPSSGVYLWKALASLAGAELELASDFFNNAVNRAYYACYQAAVAALVADGVSGASRFKDGLGRHGDFSSI